MQNLKHPYESKKNWARRRLMPWFRANMTAWVYEYVKNNMSKLSRVYSSYQLDIGLEAFKRVFGETSQCSNYSSEENLEGK